LWLIKVTKNLAHHSVWSHEHFTGATLAQFLYVAAQCGIFSFLINYMTSEPPSVPVSLTKYEWVSKRVEPRTAFANSDFKDVSLLAAKLTTPTDPVSSFLATNLSSSTRETLALFKNANASATEVRVSIMQDLNSVVLKQRLYSPERFDGITLGDETKKLLAQDAKSRYEPRLNRLLLADAYPNELSFQDGVMCFTNQFAATLASVGFIFFLIGRVTGSKLLRKVSAHRMLGLYGLLSAFACFLVYLKLGWLSALCVFLSYFMMSIQFPTIFALGIFGLGAKAKGASAYIVMGIVGGALLPKLMGSVADHYDMSRAFIVPLVCFVLVAIYGYSWSKLSRAEGLTGFVSKGGH
jgi:hypothetical protein